MPANIKGPALFLAQFAGEEAPFNALSTIAAWASDLGYKGVQVPSGDARLFNLETAANSQTYCDDVTGMLADHGLELTELSTHIQGQLLAVHPAYDQQFDAFAPSHVRGNPKARTEWAESQLLMAAKASRRLGLDVSVSFSGSLAFPYLYPWPQRPDGLIEEAFDELARRWKPIMDAYDNEGVDIAFELHPSEDLFDGVTFEMLLERLNNHPRCMINYDPSHFLLQQLDYLAFIDIYHDRISAFHVKDAEFLPSGRQGVYSGYQPWLKRAGRFRSLGDGQVDFKSIFSKMAEYGYDGWAVLEWECCLKDAAVGAAEGAPFISNHIIEVTDKAFDDFAGTGMDRQGIHKMLGL
ncbi:MAG: sugar phosphate isomerase/epimerase [Pelagimonas sp.]